MYPDDALPKNMSLIENPNLCTLDTCPLKIATVTYDPSLGGNIFYLGVFLTILLVQLGLGIRYRTWAFLSAMIGGGLLEVIGYIARVQMSYNPFLANPFLMYLICLTIAPCFLSAGIYLCLSRIIVVCGEHHARFKPKTYTIIFISCDVFSLVLQALGGALADTAKPKSSLLHTGVNIMIAGLAFQVISLTIFMLLCGDFARRVIKHGASPRDALRKFGCSRGRFHGFLAALALATLTIYVRSCFRVAELRGGFGGALANQQTTFMILEGLMVIVACIALTVMHPGFVFKAFWKLSRAREGLYGVSDMVGGVKGGVPLSRRNV